MFHEFKCPKCGVVCERFGAVDDPSIGLHLDIFQCENAACNVTLYLGDETFAAAFTFAVGPDGQAFDPAECMEPIDD